MEKSEILEILFNELGDMYDELAARTLTSNIIHKKYEDLFYSELCDKMIDIINAIRKG